MIIQRSILQCHSQDNMLTIHTFLDKFKNLTNTEKVKKELIAEICKKNNIPVLINQITLSKRIIYITTSPIIKTEILLKKREVLEEIKKIPTLQIIDDLQ